MEIRIRRRGINASGLRCIVAKNAVQRPAMVLDNTLGTLLALQSQ